MLCEYSRSLCGQKGRTHVGQRKQRNFARKAGLAGAIALGGFALAGCDVKAPTAVENLLGFGWPKGITPEAESMYNFWIWVWVAAWIVGFIIPAALMLISYFIHGCIYYNDKLDYIVDHEKPSYTRMMIQLLIAFMFIMITGTTVWNSFYTLLLLISPVLFLLYPIIIIFFFNSGTVLCNAILIPAENDDENTEYFQ